ncbi:arginine--tRNA ligase [Flavitalea sp. BT771]|uniref:arginine--tRNA ligase n=1 Tax=Flavitalea sp. BT771 TaxID=3063329 RepID=UPI0026E11C6C|nr:arginine--tRNA ligase [Flavitalea sp. BT771]MDO6431794.1 arginine--tRNA ligase [Flavitalea sp. BT771]MDV6220702.1 arginine--tRNA ligase [Flavitalea sp. BT771]
MDIISQIRSATGHSLLDSYQYHIAPEDIQVNETKPEFEGDYTVVLFSFVKSLKKSPEALGNELGQTLLKGYPHLFAAFNVIKGFLNLTVSDIYWTTFLSNNQANERFGLREPTGQKVMVEYSSPNTNKPLHLGHLRNNFLGWSVAALYKANGYDIVKTCIANDRGIHICKSMIAWKRFANGATPESTGIKGDHLVGDYYVKFGEELKKQAKPLLEAFEKGDDSAVNVATRPTLQRHLETISKLETEILKAPNDKQRGSLEEKLKTEKAEVREIADSATEIMKAAQQMLVDWEAGKPDVIELWRTMNSWVYAGFDETYKRIGSDFDKIYYESNTYILGKQLVEFGLQKGVFFKKDDGSVWIDLEADGLDQKIVQRKDGTAVYITQDIGLAVKKYEEYKADQSIYVVGDEQNYHFKVLKLICQKLELPSADGIYHLSYGMVELPTGRMKTREGTVVDADDLLDEMIREAEAKTKEQGKTEGFTPEELKELYETIGLGGLKFFLLRVDPKKRMVFNPSESIDLHGYTATFIQYAYARIRSVLRKEAAQSAGIPPAQAATVEPSLLPLEKKLIFNLERYPAVLAQAVAEMSPSVVAAYAFEVAQTFNSFYGAHKIANAETPEKKIMRLEICQLTATVLQSAMGLLGIRMPERM